MPTVNHKESASSSQVVPELSQGSAKPVKKLSRNTAQETPQKVDEMLSPQNKGEEYGIEENQTFQTNEVGRIAVILTYNQSS